MRRNLLRGTTALVIVGGLALVGCSSNDGADVIAPKQTTPPLSKTDYLEQANAICSKAEEQIIELQSGDSSDGGSRSADERDTLVGEITPIAQDAIDELEALTPPAADAAMITEGIDRMQSTLDTAQTDATAIFDPIGISGPELNEYGLTSCFSAGPPLDTSGTTAP